LCFQRFREVSFDYGQEFQKTSVSSHVIACYSVHLSDRVECAAQGSIQQKRDRASLFGNRKEDDEKTTEMDLLMKERNSIHKSQQMTDSVIGQALATREALKNQQSTFTNSSSKLGQIAGKFVTYQLSARMPISYQRVCPSHIFFGARSLVPGSEQPDRCDPEEEDQEQYDYRRDNRVRHMLPPLHVRAPMMSGGVVAGRGGRAEMAFSFLWGAAERKPEMSSFDG
jgi:hypothetical protein